MADVRLIVITGGPGSGKTTLIAELARRGYPTIPEAAMSVIEDLNGRMGLDEQKRWRRAHPMEFQVMVTARQVEFEAAAPEQGAVYCDRGRLDSLAYCVHNSIEPTPALREAAMGQRYSRVFILDTLVRFPERMESGRTSNQETSRRIRDCIEQIYRAHQYEPVCIPEMPVQERADRVEAEARERGLFCGGATGAG